MYVYLKKNANGCQVSKFDKCMGFYIIKIKILKINFTKPARTVAAYPMVNISFELA